MEKNFEVCEALSCGMIRYMVIVKWHHTLARSWFGLIRVQLV
jgi:hypothetical protein